jgi:4-diphosphocytidyl-2-C-methyl-D-erythritol kinase
MAGIGELLMPVELPPFAVVLANPRVPVPTAAVFAGLHSRSNPPMPAVPALRSAAALAGFLAAQRNDLEPPATEIAPAIAACRGALAVLPGCLLARMSGSGGTCFGLFAEAEAAAAGARMLERAEPGWWVAAAPVP